MMSDYDLERFVTAQEGVYDRALTELENGRKETHWMWYIFPQIFGLGHSENADYYGIQDLQEARDYYAHPILSARLMECCYAVLEHEEKSAGEIFGEIDSLKLRSCMTLFELVGEGNPVFEQILDQFFDGERDELTLELLGM